MMSANSLELLRIAGLLIFALSRFLSFRVQIQAFLSIALENVLALAKENGQISLEDYQKKILPSFHYVCVAAIQLLGFPMLMVISTLSLKSLGGYDLGLLPSLSNAEGEKSSDLSPSNPR